MARWLFLPDATLRDLATLAAMSEQNVRVLADLLDAADQDNLYSGYVQIAETLGISDQDAASLYNFWEYVQREKRDSNQSPAAVVSEFVSFLKTKSEVVGLPNPEEYKDYAKHIEEKKSSLERLFGSFPNRDFKQKSHSLESGPLPRISNIKAYCDIRPIYNQSGLEIIDCRPIVTLRVAIHDTLDEHKEFFVQISESTIELIESEFRRLRGKLKSHLVTGALPADL